jgi:molecular chaperone Hsp33
VLVTDTIPDDIVLSFETIASGAKGRIVRLGSAVDTILKRHAYPDSVSEAAAQALAMIAMLGAPLAASSKLSLQTRTDGPLRFLLADIDGQGHLRATASFDKAKLAVDTKVAPQALLGSGHMALTLDRDGQDPHQGIVAIDGLTLEQSAAAYFEQSEQLPTFLSLAVAKHFSAGQWRWRAGGLMLQTQATTADDEAWNRVNILASTIEDHELLDPTLAPDRLLMRLFHEDGVRVFPAKPLSAHCTCSRAKVEGFLKSFGVEQMADMTDDSGKISVSCEFCSAVYAFEPSELAE